MEISQLLLDVRSKTNNFQNVYYMAANHRKGTDRVLDPTYEHIGNVQKLDCSECSILKLFMKASACLYTNSKKYYLSTTFLETNLSAFVDYDLWCGLEKRTLHSGIFFFN